MNFQQSKMKNLKREFESVDDSNDRENFGFDANRLKDSRKIMKCSNSFYKSKVPVETDFIDGCSTVRFCEMFGN